MTFLQLAQRILNEEKQPLSASEIWQIAVAKGYEKQVDSKGKTPWATLGAQIYVDVRDNNQSVFSTIGSRPKRFVLKNLYTLETPTPETVKIPQLIDKKPDFLEKDLHPLMSFFGFYYLKAYLKTINHSKSDKKGFGEWVHPDVVGCYFPFRDWEEKVVQVSSLMGNTAVKLYSFELKRELSLSNLRESFFQSVSNSSWANEGYLVAAQIDTDEDFITELKRLSTAFGIGVIKLDIEDPDSSEVMLPAKVKDLVDWDTVNKLSVMNPDFRDFLIRIHNDMNTREVRNELYDPVLDKNELIKRFIKKKV